MDNLIPVERIESKIFLIRGQKVILDTDLAELYEVRTFALKQAVKRNIERFPEDFLFQLSEQEKEEVATNCEHLKKLKYSYQLPYAFTEQGVAMLSSVLRSKRAIQVNIAIMRAFIKLKQILFTHKEFAQRLSELERKFEKHDLKIQAVFDAINKLMEPIGQPVRAIGFVKEGRGTREELKEKKMVKDFYDLEVWKKAQELTVLIYKITKEFPKEETYGLTSQLRRSSGSIGANIAEGFSRYHTKDKIRFYYNARGSISESISHILLARDIGYIDPDKAANFVREFESVRKMLNGMITSLNHHSQTFTT